MEDSEDDVPARVAQQSLERGDHAVVQRTDRLAAEEPRVLRHDVLERAEEHPFQLLDGEVGEPAGRELPQLGPRLGLDAGSDDARGLHGAREIACDDAVEFDACERVGRSFGLLAAGERQRHAVRMDGAPIVVVRHLAVSHQVDPAAAHS